MQLVSENIATTLEKYCNGTSVRIYAFRNLSIKCLSRGRLYAGKLIARGTRGPRPVPGTLILFVSTNIYRGSRYNEVFN